MSNQKMIVASGVLIGILAVILVFYGNPINMGICVACFIRDTAGALKLHSAPVVQYIRPEIIGFILGAFIISVITKEFKPTGGSAPLTRFVLGFFVMIGALVFLGCPLRMILRLAGGDLNAFVGLLGFGAGILGGIFVLKKGFSLGRAYQINKSGGFIMPAVAIALLILLVVSPEFIARSIEGPGSMAAPIALSLGAGIVVGIFCQRSRLCMAGGIRDIFLIKNPHLLIGFLCIFVFAFIGNMAMGSFKLGFLDQPVAHTDGIWNFLGMALVGLGSTMLGGCPLRQTILAGEGNTDSGVTFMGLLLGGAFAHNFGLAASAKGVPMNGQIAVIIGFVVFALIAFMNMKSMKAAK